MASRPVAIGPDSLTSGLADPARSIGGARFDAAFFWGIPLICFVLVQAWVAVAARLNGATGDAVAGALVAFSAVITYAHLIAVAPRAYLNREVFASNRSRLTIVPLIMLAAFLVSPTLLLMGGVVAVFWDIHHSAMQNFGLGRIYDMKAGNAPDVLRTVDMRLNWFLYVGPLLAGASLMTHFGMVHRLDYLNIHVLQQAPGWVESHVPAIRWLGIGAWVSAVGSAVIAYRRAMANGYRLPVHKAALIGSTGLVSLLAWGLSSPIVAFAAINIYHAIQYFALVWLKEGKRLSDVFSIGPAGGLAVLLCGCGVGGLFYFLTTQGTLAWSMAPFVACSLLHFWFDSFVWSVSRKQV